MSYATPIKPFFQSLTVSATPTVITFPGDCTFLNIANYGGSEVSLYLNQTVGPIHIAADSIFEFPPFAFTIQSVKLVVVTSGQTSSDCEVIAGYTV